MPSSALSAVEPFASIHYDTFLQRPRIGDADLSDHDVIQALCYLEREFAPQLNGCQFDLRHAKAPSVLSSPRAIVAAMSCAS